MVSTKLLKDAGEALYGPRWQSELARKLQISDRTVRRWIASADDMPTGVAGDLRRICEEKIAHLEHVVERLKVAANDVVE